jgi:hypothetical protein
MTTFDDTDRRAGKIWNITDIMRRVKPEDLTDAELAAIDAILSLASARLSPKPTVTIQLDTTGFDVLGMNGTEAPEPVGD